MRWFALAAVILSVASMAGARGLEWLSQSGRVSLVAFRSTEPALTRRTATLAPDVDPMPTGSIPSDAVMIRIR